MTYIYSGLVSLAVAMLAFLLQSQIKENKVLKEEKEQESQNKKNALENAILCLLRTELIKIYDKCIERQYITASEYENGMEMYEAYKALGGNGLVKHMKDEIEELRLKTRKG